MSGDDVTLMWSGEVDLDVSANLRREISAMLDTANPRRLVIDMANVSFLDSSGIGVLADAYNRCLEQDIDIVLRSVSNTIKRVISITGLDDMFTYDDPHPTGELTGESLPWATSLPAVPDAKLDRLAALCARVLRVPTALVTLVDHEAQVFPGAVGLPAPWQDQRTTPLSHSFCQHVVDRAAPLVVADATVDPLLARNLAVPDLNVVAYAGMPLVDLDRRVVGSLCAIDSVARDWTDQELRDLRDLADICSSEIQLRSAKRRLARINELNRSSPDRSGSDPTGA